MPATTTLLLLFAAAAAVALVARRLHIPYTVGLVLTGLVLGALHLHAGVHLTQATLYSVFLPGLLFEAAYHLRFTEFRKSILTIFALAVPGVIGAIASTATLIVVGAHAAGFSGTFGWSAALMFSSLIAATDPIAVVALFKVLGAPKRLAVLTDGESLINDGTAVVFFTLIFAAVSGDGGFTVAGAALSFFKMAGLGALTGAALAFAGSLILRRIDDPMVEITVTVIVAYGSFVLAEALHLSGVIATVTAGMICGSYAAPRVLTPTTRVALETFWEYVAFALNSLVFLLIGLEVRVTALLQAWVPIALAFVAVTVGRAAVVFAVSAALRSTRERIPWTWSVMLTWGGLRGALSMVLALALPLDFPQRDLLVTMTFGVVLLSILIQGTTAGPLLRALGLATTPRARKLLTSAP